MRTRLFVSAFLVWLTSCAVTPPVSVTPSVKQMEANGAQLEYVEQGKGVPVVFVHGSMSDYRAWTQQMSPVSRHYRAISYSQRYFGTADWRSDWPKFGVGVHAADLAAFIRGLGAGPVHVVGWSYGASVGLAMVQKYPDLVISAFLYEPAHPTFVTDQSELKALTDDRATFAPAVQAARAGDNMGAARMLFDLVSNRANFYSTLPPEVQSMVTDNARTMPLLLTAQEAPPPISCSVLQKMQTRVAIARGENTRTLYRVISDAASKCMPNSRHIVVPGATHMWPLNDPAAFSEKVLNFLNGLE